MDDITKLKLWRGAAIVAIVVAILLLIGLILSFRIEKIKTISIEKTRFVNKNVYIVRVEQHDPATGNLTTVTTTTTDHTQSGSTAVIHDKETTKPVSKTFLISVGYDLKAGTFTAGAGVIVLNFISVQATNPVALKFQPALMASILF